MRTSMLSAQRAVATVARGQGARPYAVPRCVTRAFVPARRPPKLLLLRRLLRQLGPATL